MEEEIEEILEEEKEDKLLAQTEMQVRKGENLMAHEAEIKGRPKRTWFESEADKVKAKKAGHEELNGKREKIIKAKGGKLSHKDKKKLDNTETRKEEKVWKKGRAERDGKGVLEKKKNEGKKKKAYVKGKKPGGQPATRGAKPGGKR